MDGADKLKKQAVVCVLAAGFVTSGMVLSFEEGGKGARDVCDSVFILGGALQFVQESVAFPAAAAVVGVRAAWPQNTT